MWHDSWDTECDFQYKLLRRRLEVASRERCADPIISMFKDFIWFYYLFQSDPVGYESCFEIK